jgi:hypothetical protein
MLVIKERVFKVICSGGLTTTEYLKWKVKPVVQAVFDMSYSDPVEGTDLFEKYDIDFNLTLLGSRLPDAEMFAQAFLERMGDNYGNVPFNCEVDAGEAHIDMCVTVSSRRACAAFAVALAESFTRRIGAKKIDMRAAICMNRVGPDDMDAEMLAQHEGLDLGKIFEFSGRYDVLHHFGEFFPRSCV